MDFVINRDSCIDYIEVHIDDHDNYMDTNNRLDRECSHIVHHCNTYLNKKQIVVFVLKSFFFFSVVLTNWYMKSNRLLHN